jgi:HEAT repeat protein
MRTVVVALLVGLLTDTTLARAQAELAAVVSRMAAGPSPSGQESVTHAARGTERLTRTTLVGAVHVLGDNAGAEAVPALADVERRTRPELTTDNRRRELWAASLLALGRIRERTGAVVDAAITQTVAFWRDRLSDQDAGKVQSAVEAVALLADNDAVPLVIEVAMHGPSTTRETAVAALRRNAADPATRAALARIAASRRGAWILAAMGLAAAGDPRAREPLLGLLREPAPPAHRIAALAALTPAIGDDRDAQAAVRAALADAAGPVRAGAARALGQAGDGGALPWLERAVHDRLLRVRLEALRAIAQVGGPGSVAVLERVARTHPDPATREAARSLAVDPAANPLAGRSAELAAEDLRERIVPGHAH